MNIAQIYGQKAVVPYTNSKAIPQSVADPNLIMGVELEIESVPQGDELRVPGMVSTEDGSLRNHGREYITNPMTGSVLYHVLNNFFTKNKEALSKADNYSERTSIHVHCNCQDLTIPRLKTVLMLYQVYEKLLYAYIGNDRDKNIFCVPWSETMLTYSLLDKLLVENPSSVDLVRHWQKYTGLNLLPLRAQGTIEFRHMHGNNDLTFIFNWTNLIGSLFAKARSTDFEEVKESVMNLNTTSNYILFTEEIFKQWSPLLMTNPNYRELLEEGVLNVKFLVAHKEEKTKKPFGSSEYDITWDEVNRMAVDFQALRREGRANRFNAVPRAVDLAAAQQPVEAAAGGRRNPFAVPPQFFNQAGQEGERINNMLREDHRELE